jgi:hypothetical protein
MAGAGFYTWGGGCRCRPTAGGGTAHQPRAAVGGVFQCVFSLRRG